MRAFTGTYVVQQTSINAQVHKPNVLNAQVPTPFPANDARL